METHNFRRFPAHVANVGRERMETFHEPIEPFSNTHASDVGEGLDTPVHVLGVLLLLVLLLGVVHSRLGRPGEPVQLECLF